ncbi:(2Fe-2S)-binding protein [Devosia sp.]|uniref:(2Fe-2S)-binding protein n=1 Tax=Devosia sp. TaxID=1871048 RepID=UPI001A02A610|nr:(2Fe-2S)-binding protein [Devosia sp.]MBE0579847.1 (2Fe-2S)-binding protein [Devosia sp.]
MSSLVRPLAVSRTETVAFTFDDASVTCHRGESIAAALGAQGTSVLRHNAFDGTARGAFCFMGICQECVVEIDGRRVEACRTPAVDGMHVHSLRNRASNV